MNKFFNAFLKTFLESENTPMILFILFIVSAVDSPKITLAILGILGVATLIFAIVACFVGFGIEVYKNLKTK